jgi:DNA ligase-1
MSFKQFSNLVNTLGATTKTGEKLGALKDYFETAPDKDKVWTVALFTGRRPKRFVSGSLMAGWVIEITGLPTWLFTECYGTVGDMSETLALLLPENHDSSNNIAEETLTSFLEKFVELQKADEEVKKVFVTDTWRQMNIQERFVFNKLMSANFRIGVSANLIVQALGTVTGLDNAEVSHRISGSWDPSIIGFEALLLAHNEETDASKPYPFYLAYPLEETPESLGDPTEWQAEWKWDGIRGQIIKRKGQLFVWSRGEELMTEKFPEYEVLKTILPDGTCLDGEIIPMKDGKPMPFSLLQTRIGRKNISKKQLQDVPVGFIAYDLLEWEGMDIRQQPMMERRVLLKQLFANIESDQFILSPELRFVYWDELVELRMQSRAMQSEGLMLKRKTSPYQTGRKRGDWWKWKIDPMTIDAVMIYAQKGSGRRSNLYTDYTFAVRDGDKLVPFTKAYSGLTDKEFVQVDAFVKKNAIEKFGPVRTVKPELVFEIGFEGIAASKRHKSGVALRFPRMLRWRTDKKMQEINTLEDLKKMLEWYGSHDEEK